VSRDDNSQGSPRHTATMGDWNFILLVELTVRSKMWRSLPVVNSYLSLCSRRDEHYTWMDNLMTLTELTMDNLMTFVPISTHVLKAWDKPTHANRFSSKIFHGDDTWIILFFVGMTWEFFIVILCNKMKIGKFLLVQDKWINYSSRFRNFVWFCLSKYFFSNGIDR